MSSNTSLPTLTDAQLLELCSTYGSQAKLWKQRFLGLLPEVDRRKLYLQAGCTSLFEFAAKVGGVSREQVGVVLRLYERFQVTPVLKQALISGEVSPNKLARVVSVATPANQEFLLRQTKLLSSRSLETLVQDTKSLHVQTKKPNKIPQFDELGLSSQITQRLLDLRNKGLDLNQVLGELLDERERKIQEEKKSVAEELRQKALAGEQRTSFLPSRYIPKKVTNLLTQEFGTKCAHEQCVNKAENVHHKLRFSLNPFHDPLYLVPVCKQHLEIAHAVDVKVLERRLQGR